METNTGHALAEVITANPPVSVALPDEAVTGGSGARPTILNKDKLDDSKAAPESTGDASDEGAGIEINSLADSNVNTPLVQGVTKVPVPLEIQLAMIPQAYLKNLQQEQKEVAKLKKQRRKPKLAFKPQPTAAAIAFQGIWVNDTHYTMPPPPRRMRQQQRQPTAAEAAALGDNYKEKWGERVFIYDANNEKGASPGSQRASRALGPQSTLVIGEDEDASQTPGAGPSTAPAQHNRRILRPQSTEIIEDDDMSQTPGAGPSTGVNNADARALCARDTEVLTSGDVLGNDTTANDDEIAGPSTPFPSNSPTKPTPCTPATSKESLNDDMKQKAVASTTTSSACLSHSPSNATIITPQASFALSTEPPAPLLKRKLRSTAASSSLRHRLPHDSTQDDELSTLPPKKRARTRRTVPQSDRVLRPRRAPATTNLHAPEGSNNAISAQISCGPSAKKSRDANPMRVKSTSMAQSGTRTSRRRT